MYDLPESYINAATAAARKIALRVDLGEVRDGSYVDKASYTGGKGVLSLKIVRGQTTGGFSLGGTVCATLTATFSNDVEINVKDRIQVYVGFGAPESVPKWQGLGWFYVDSVKKGMDNQSVTACDAMLRFAKNYKSKLTYPAKVSNILEEISGQTKINLSSGLSLFNDVQIEKTPEKGEDKDGNKQYYTRREVLGYLAGINGGSAYIDVDFKINFAVPKETGYTISWKNTTSQSVDDTDFSLSHIVWNRSGITHSLGDDFEENTVEFTDPLAYTSSELILHNLETNIIGLSYNSITIKKQGTGMFQLGDLVDYEALDGKTYKMLIMGIVYDFSGGFFSETLYSLAKSASQQEYAGNQVIDQTEHIKETAGTGGVGKAAESDPTSEYFNDYTGNAITGKYPYPYPNSPYEKGYNRVEGHKNTLLDSYGTHVEGAGNTVSRVIDSHIGGDGNTVEGGYCLLIQGNNNAVHRWEDTDGSRHLLLMGDGNKVGVSGNANFSIVDGINCYLNNIQYSIVLGDENRISKLLYGLILGQLNEINSDYTFAFGKGLKTNGNGSVNNFQIMLGQYNAVAKQIKPKSAMSYGYNILFSLGAGSGSSASRRSTALIIDEAGNIYCNKVYELGSKITSDMVTEKGIIDASSLINQSSIATASAAQTITSASSSGIPIMLLDHTPTANDLTGSECVFLQCDNTASVEGETTGIFRVTDIFAEKSLQ